MSWGSPSYYKPLRPPQYSSLYLQNVCYGKCAPADSYKGFNTCLKRTHREKVWIDNGEGCCGQSNGNGFSLSLLDTTVGDLDACKGRCHMFRKCGFIAHGWMGSGANTQLCRIYEATQVPEGQMCNLLPYNNGACKQGWSTYRNVHGYSLEVWVDSGKVDCGRMPDGRTNTANTLLEDVGYGNEREACKKACGEKAGCTHMTWVKQTKDCNLYSSCSNPQPAEGVEHWSREMANTHNDPDGV